ncbi:cytochrome c [Methylorubrum populi]|uniref:c-type cytochrome n=1 Tax=Methylorubrum populi TaxID=223967 RepID=UPI001153688D|nr:cytochrome c [Methylorubrum populi]QDI81747.1 cytochrome c [Methylorubrum populi]
MRSTSPEGRQRLGSTLAVVLTLSAGSVPATAALAADGPFTKEQAENGHLQFNNHCAECHRPDLTGALGPSLINPAFKQKWAGKPIADLRDWIQANMPASAPGTLKEDQLDPIVAWILMKNGVQPGSTALSKTTASAVFPKS